MPEGLILILPPDKSAWQPIHFAGEHRAIASPGMESALESAERVVGEILARR
ncbi:MAG: hypothetical protein EBE86_007495 [Hormoscilla sp. GUM202]|nr:hypothetical protein [Hormoscilla sp. GUM202]